MKTKQQTITMPVEYGRYLFGKGSLAWEDVDHLGFLQGELGYEYGEGARITKETLGKPYHTLFMDSVRLCQDYVVILARK